MAHSMKYALAAFAMVSTPLVMAEPAQAQSVGDVLEVITGGNSWDRTMQRSRQEADRRYNDQMNDRRQREREWRQVPEAAAQHVQRNGGDYRYLVNCGRAYVSRDGLRAYTAVQLCATYNSSASQQQQPTTRRDSQYGPDYYERARRSQQQRQQQQGSQYDHRQPVTYTQFDHLVKRCAADARAEAQRRNHRMTQEQAINLCAQEGMKRVRIVQGR